MRLLHLFSSLAMLDIFGVMASPVPDRDTEILPRADADTPIVPRDTAVVPRAEEGKEGDSNADFAVTSDMWSPDNYESGCYQLHGNVWCPRKPKKDTTPCYGPWCHRNKPKKVTPMCYGPYCPPEKPKKKATHCRYYQGYRWCRKDENDDDHDSRPRSLDGDICPRPRDISCETSNPRLARNGKYYSRTGGFPGCQCTFSDDLGSTE